MNNTTKSKAGYGRALTRAGLLLSLALFTLIQVAVRGAEVHFIWQPNTEADLAGYRLYCHIDAPAQPVVTEVGLATRHTVAGLEPQRTYTFYLTAFNLVGLESDPSDTVTLVIPSVDQPPPTVNLTAEVHFIWQPNTETDLAGYRLYCHNQSEPHRTLSEVGLVTSCTVEGLLPGQTYDFYLTAYNLAGLESDPSKVVRIVVPPEGLPPTTVRLASDGPEFTWPATPGLAYQIQYKDDMTEPEWKELVTVLAGNTQQVYRDYSRGPDNRPLLRTHPRRFYRIVEMP